MTSTPTVTIEPGPTTNQAGIDKVLDQIRAEHPDVSIKVNPSPEVMLREATRRYAPEVADAIDAGDFPKAAELFLAWLDARVGSAS